MNITTATSDRELGRYRLLSPSAGVRVSPLCLGAMSLGEAWGASLGTTADLEASFKFLDMFYDNGGNFIDTANNYQEGQSERFIGEWMKARRNRDEIVLATKYTIGYKNTDPKVKLKGNHRKSLVHSVEDSLKKLQTSYIDLLYLHLWDYSTSIPEIMQALDALVKAGKVLYLGISDTPAWIVVKANEYARAHGMAQFVVYQGQWALTMRDLEREILPMCRAEGMAVAPWGVLGQGFYKTEAEIKARGGMGRYGRGQSAEEKAVSTALEKVAAEIGEGVSLCSVAIAWALHKAPYVFPIAGGRKPEQLEEVLKGLEIELTPEQMKTLEDAAPFTLGFPYLAYFGTDPATGDGAGNFFVKTTAPVKFVKASAPVKPGPLPN
ncbi:Aldo/keto reductase [Lentinus tigrinus ALCF2SS1-6]|uniref:Aldo/keto reductase n=1 Tax=Lentinus tigrinus ALCF2SS1-6 TaxID=1328759 RepID=A0A5C2SME5_9APHY|nr:Aldo/keto reductase [Lentinus tigrinus ALCF2SS1-6]